MLKTISGDLEGGTEDFKDAVHGWITHRPLFRHKDPTKGARNLFEYASGKKYETEGWRGCDFNVAGGAAVATRRPDVYPTQTISSDPPEEPIRRFLPYRTIPKMGIDAPGYTQHTVRFGDRIGYLSCDYGYHDPLRFASDVARLNPDLDMKRQLDRTPDIFRRPTFDTISTLNRIA